MAISRIGFQIPGVRAGLIAMKVIGERDCGADGFKLTFLEEYPASGELYSVNQAAKELALYRSRHQSQDISVTGDSDEREAEENGSLPGAMRCDAMRATEDTRTSLSTRFLSRLRNVASKFNGNRWKCSFKYPPYRWNVSVVR